MKLILYCAFSGNSKRSLSKHLVLLAICACVFGCASAPIRHIRWNEAKYGYEVNTARDTTSYLAREQWSVLRRPGQKAKVLDSIEAAQLVATYNGEDRPLKLTDVTVTQQPFSFRQYRAGQEYFKALSNMRGRRFVEATGYLERASKHDAKLEYFSDIDYLRAVCALSIGDTVAADSCFARFIHTSESAVPLSLVFRTPTGVPTVGQLSGRGRDSAVLYAGHFSETAHGPVLKHPPFHGFLGVPIRKPILDILVGVQYAGDGTRPIGEIGLTFPFGLRPYAGTWYHAWDCGLQYQIYRCWDNRLGATATVQYQQNGVEVNSQERVTVPQVGLNIEVGHFVLPRLALFTGGTYYLWNNSNKYEKSNHVFWHDNDLYTGVGFYIWEYIAVVGKVGVAQRLQLGFNMSGMDMLFDIE